jgi:hypothetical protein
MEKNVDRAAATVERWTLLRDIGVLQIKLVVDGIRDLILVPASLAVGIYSLFSGKNGRPGAQFYELLSWGKDSEIWINLFGAVENSPESFKPQRPFGDQDIDRIVGRLESLVRDEVKRGGVTKHAKERVEKILDAMQRKGRKE